ncbi:MAG: hypothetical protein ABI885_19040 [Gammaproteobacteria bacterium]
MRKNVVLKFKRLTAGLPGIALAGVLVGCSGGSTPPAPAPATTALSATEDTKAAELAAREQDLARREAELAAKEQEREAARLQAEETARQESEAAAAKAAGNKKPVRAKPTSSNTAMSSAPKITAPKPAPAPVHIVVPAGTQLSVALASDLSTKTSTPGDAFEARLASDLMVDNRVAVPAGARVTGTITDVISGSNAIGAVPMLGLKFNHLELANGQSIPISGEINEQGKSEKVQDTAKILGGVAAGAILGHQVKTNNRGKVIGGLLGGAIGAVAAKKTGSEVVLAAGSTLTIALGEGFTVNQ